jgi:isoleucyl-tRNA synthetase
VLSFFTTYATIDEYNAEWQLPDPQKNLADRWLLSRLNRLVSDVVEQMDQYDYYQATVAIDFFIEELSNWFIRTSRRRFWKSEQDSDKTSAYVTLSETLWTLSKLIAPFVPFIAEHIYKTLVRYGLTGKESVHLESYPTAETNRRSPEIEQEMDYAKRIVEVGRTARSSAHVKTRQPLKQLICVGPELKSNDLETIVLTELNVKAINFESDETKLVDHEIGLNFASVGPKFNILVPEIKKAVGRMDPKTMLEKLESGIELQIGAKKINLLKEDLIISEKAKVGLVKSEDRGLSVFLDIELTSELKQELLAREIVRRIQIMRKELNLPYAARIKVSYRSSAEVSKAIQAYYSYIKDETLSVSVKQGEDETAKLSRKWVIEGHPVVISLT